MSGKVTSIYITNFSFFILAFFLISCSIQRHTNTVNEWNYNYFRSNQKSFHSQDGIIKYIDRGDGPVILLLHGIPTSSWLYRKMMNGLVDGGYRVIAPDMLGFGNSDNPKSYDLYSPAAHSQRIIALMDFLKIKQWNHVMHDAGGLWTWEMLKNHPSRIGHLIILNSIIYEEGFNPPIRMKKGIFGKFSMWLYRNGITTDILLKQLFKKGLKKNNLSKAELEGYRLPLIEGKTNGMYQFFTNTCSLLPNYEATIQQLNIPTTVIWGKYDEMLQWETQRIKLCLQLNIPEKDVHLLDAKHFIQEEKSDTINQIILNFIH